MRTVNSSKVGGCSVEENIKSMAVQKKENIKSAAVQKKKNISEDLFGI